ncbi:uncharacterized protein LOC143821378 [Paroedura picta]|uniref:uncharacterized protein LOC143821378 n=1 Tax=Paroedura picta TaxID=143630 RepID=UPI0040566B4A
MGPAGGEGGQAARQPGSERRLREARGEAAAADGAQEIPQLARASFPALLLRLSTFPPKCALAFVEDRILRHLGRVGGKSERKPEACTWENQEKPKLEWAQDPNTTPYVAFSLQEVLQK